MASSEITPDAAPRRPGGDGRLPLAAFTIAWIPYAFLVWRFRFVTDDAFISFRYARNLALGHGLRFNLGDHTPVEGYSNFLWVLMASGFEFLQLRVTFWMPLISAICGTALLYLVFDRLRCRLGVGAPAAVGATVLMGTFPPFAVWSTGGLETMPFALVLFVLFDRLILGDRVDVAGASVAALLLAFLRVEGVLWVGVVTAVALVFRWTSGERRLRAFVVFGLIVVSLIAVYCGWRWWYFEDLLPNTVRAKGGFPLRYLSRGFDYLSTYVLTFLTPAVLVVTTFFALRRRRRPVVLAVATMAWAFPAYAVVTTGDFMTMGRFLVPGIAFGSILLAWTLDDLLQGAPARRGAVAAAALALLVIGLLPGWGVHLVPEAARRQFHFRHNSTHYDSEYEKWKLQRDQVERRGRCGQALKLIAAMHQQSEPTLVAGPMGAIGYYSNFYIHDRNGLVTPDVTRVRIAPDAPMKSPGHDRHVGPLFFADEEPTFLTCKTKVGSDPAKVADEVGQWAEEQNGRFPSLREHYVPDFARIDLKSRDGPSMYVVLWRRLPDQADADAEWRDFDGRVEKLLQTGRASTLDLSRSSL